VKLDPQTQRWLDRVGDEFLLKTLRSESERRENVPALVELGAVLTRLGRYDEGLQVDQRLVRLEPLEPIVHYNLACSLALLGRADDAIEELGRAIDLGYEDAEHMLKDRDLRSLRRDPRFEELARRLRESADAAERDSEKNLPD
jgi:tetratricopeptide (TPR) repeat protein